VTSFLEGKLPCYKFITVYGPTGSGKTKVLREIDSLKYPFLDLENMPAIKVRALDILKSQGLVELLRKALKAQSILSY